MSSQTRVDEVTGEILPDEPAEMVAASWADRYCELTDKREALRLTLAEIERGYMDAARDQMAEDAVIASARERLSAVEATLAALDEELAERLEDAPEGFTIDSGRFRVRKPKRRETWKLERTARDLANDEARYPLANIVRSITGCTPDEGLQAADAFIAWLGPERSLGTQGPPRVTVRPPAGTG